MSQSKSVLSAVADIFVDPKKVFYATDGQKGWTLLPLLLIMIIPFLVQFYYFSTVDMNWLADHMMAASGKDVPADQARKFINKNTMLIGVAVGQFVMVPVIMAIYSLYLHLVSRASSSEARSYGSWFCLSVWTSMPVLIASIASLIYYAAAGTNHMGPDEINFFSANALITHIPTGKPGASFMSAITPFMFWSLALVALGMQVWTKRSFVKSLLIAAAPHVVIFGIWAIVAFR